MKENQVKQMYENAEKTENNRFFQINFLERTTPF